MDPATAVQTAKAASSFTEYGVLGALLVVITALLYQVATHNKAWRALQESSTAANTATATTMAASLHELSTAISTTTRELAEVVRLEGVASRTTMVLALRDQLPRNPQALQNLIRETAREQIAAASKD